MASEWTTRPLTPGLAPIVEELALAAGQLVTLEDIEAARQRIGSPIAGKIIAARLKNRGWLLPVGPRGVYEFAPSADLAALLRRDPLRALRAALVRRPDLAAGLTFRSAAWAHGFTDSAPFRPEVATVGTRQVVALNAVARSFIFVPVLPFQTLHDLPVLAPESLLVHLAAKPQDERHWSTTLGWLPRAAAAAQQPALDEELAGRARPTRVRLGYLLSGVRPDLARALEPAAGARVPFGDRGRVRRIDPDWNVADALLPVAPDLLEPAPRR
jgi:hypothetical protein